MADYIVTEQMRAWGKVHGWNVDEYVDWFNDYLANKKGTYRDHDAAFRNCVRSDWPRIRAQFRNPMVTTVKREPEPAKITARTVNGAEWVPATATSDGYWRKK